MDGLIEEYEKDLEKDTFLGWIDFKMKEAETSKLKQKKNFLF